jgi:hypothetical protein
MAMHQDTLHTLLAGASVSAYRLVKLSSGKVIHTTAKTDNVIGASGIDGGTTDTACLVYPYGIVKLIADDAIAVGASLMPGDAGKVLTHDASATAKFIGEAITAAAADGDEFYALLYANKRLVPDAIS